MAFLEGWHFIWNLKYVRDKTIKYFRINICGWDGFHLVSFTSTIVNDTSQYNHNYASLETKLYVEIIAD